MILTADSGSTKCHWALANKGEAVTEQSINIVESRGINPVTCSREQMVEIITEELLPNINAEAVESIYFYGAGCIAGAPATLGLRDVLAEIFPNAQQIEVATDMLGAAHALCGREEGIVCILGTGSNSAHYDGQKMAKNVPCKKRLSGIHIWRVYPRRCSGSQGIYVGLRCSKERYRLE